MVFEQYAIVRERQGDVEFELVTHQGGKSTSKSLGWQAYLAGNSRRLITVLLGAILPCGLREFIRRFMSTRKT